MISRRRSRWEVLLYTLFLATICTGLSCFAEPTGRVSATGNSTAIQQPHPARAAQGHITILIPSMSATMDRNDPERLRCSAADAYIEQSRPNDQIGIIGLDNNDGSRENGPYTFQEAQVWQEPIPMNTANAQRHIQQLITTRSNNCLADSTGSNPLYDALSQALTMLSATANGATLSGSVLLLTDTLPFPDTGSQMAAIKNKLVPLFRQNSWSINVIAFGSSTDSRDFLHHDLAEATGGNFYDDYDPATSESSPLLLEPFFADTYANATGRTVEPHIAATQLNGSEQYTFTPNEETDYLNIVVVKDSASISVTLTSPSPQSRTVQSGNSGSTYALVDNDYVSVFWVQQPQAGDWTFTIKGNGTFLIDSMLTSSLKLVITPPPPSTHNILPLGDPFLVSATITKQGTYIGGLTVKATVSYTGSLQQGKSAPPRYEKQLSDKDSTGIYEASFTVPSEESPGSYTIEVSASDLSGTAPIVSPASITILLEPEPAPVFLSQQLHQPTPGPVDYSFPRPDPILLRLFGLPINVSHLPLEHELIQLPVVVPFEFEQQGTPLLNPGVTVTASYASVGSTARPQSITVGEIDHNGHISLQFPQDIAEGIYSVTFFMKSHLFSNPYTIVRIIHIVRPLSPSELEVWGPLIFDLFTGGILGILLFIFLGDWLPSRFVRAPFGQCWEVAQPRAEVQVYDFKSAGPRRYKWLLGKHVLLSENIKSQPTDIPMPAGLKFRFRRKKTIEVRSYGKARKHWRLPDGKHVRHLRFQVVSTIYHYSAPEAVEGDYTYTIYPDETLIAQTATILNISTSTSMPDLQVSQAGTVSNTASTPSAQPDQSNAVPGIPPSTPVVQPPQSNVITTEPPATPPHTVEATHSSSQLALDEQRSPISNNATTPALQPDQREEKEKKA